MQFEICQAVAQEDHALPRVADVHTVREFIDQLLEGIEGFARIGGRALRQIDVEFALQPIGLALEIHQTLHVVGVVDPGVGGIFAYKGVGRVDGRVGLPGLVVGVDQIEL